jgi:SAM-dependent methyltransferase
MNGYWGRFPATLVSRITTMFPPEKCRFLHLCCGRAHIDGALNVDVNPLPEADIVADAEALPFKKNMFDVCLIDPPYSQEDATRYGVSRLVSAGRVMRQLLRVLSPGGWLLWLDEKYPSVDTHKWHLQGLVAVVCGANRRTRILSVFQKR